MRNIFKQAIIKVRQTIFRKKFMHIGNGSGVGSLGYGNTCKILGTESISIGNCSWIGNNSHITVHNDEQCNRRATLLIGDGVGVTNRIYIECFNKIIIGNDVLIAPDVLITDGSQTRINNTVIIEEGVWIGHNACVLPGVTVGEHTIIGANSVVTHSIDSYSIAAGVPARVIKQWDFNNKKWVSVNRRAKK